MNKIFTIINMILIFCIVNFLISGFYKYCTWKLGIDDYPQTIETGQQIFKKKNSKALSFYKNIENRDLFGTKKNQKLIKPGSQKKISKKMEITNLAFELKGTITGTGSKPFALISEKGKKKEVFYTIGDSVDKAEVKSIFRKKVILLVDGRHEILLMQKNKGGINDVKNALEPAFFQQTPDQFSGNIKLTRNDINIFKKNFRDLKKQIRVQPHFSKNKIDGFIVSGMKRDSVFYKTLGLKNGDIVTDINGQSIKSINDVMTVYKKLNLEDDRAAAAVGIKRKGSAKTIKYLIE